MKKLILIGGDLAGGKSSFAEILRKRFGVMVINKDKIKEILGDTIYAKNREENKRLSVISFHIMQYILEKNEAILVLESNFKEAEAQWLTAWTEENGVPVLTLRFTGNSRVLQKRFLSRLEEHRHYVHKSQDFSSLADFENALEELRRVKYPGRIIEIDCTDFSYQTNETLFREISAFIEA